ncbi:transposase, partial [Xanthomonas campestris pv. campestris]|nr:transposase [Xanthomonas campestris pv. campestris]
MRQKIYPSDMSREQFEHVLPILEQARKRTKPRRVDVYEVWCAVLYVLRTGCQWRALPSDFPKWRTVHSYFAKWSECDDEGVSLLEQALKKIRLAWPAADVPPILSSASVWSPIPYPEEIGRE